MKANLNAVRIGGRRSRIGIVLRLVCLTALVVGLFAPAAFALHVPFHSGPSISHWTPAVLGGVIVEAPAADEPPALPTTGLIGLCIVIGVCIIAGAFIIMRK